jgi:D-3-phosphoglycerate dehydrogenase
MFLPTCETLTGFAEAQLASMNIVILDDYQDAVRKLACAAKLEPYQAKVYTNTVKGLGQLSVRLKDADVIVLNRDRTQMPRALIDKLPRLKLIVQTGRVGAHLDVNACTERGIAWLLLN